MQSLLEVLLWSAEMHLHEFSAFYYDFFNIKLNILI